MMKKLVLPIILAICAGPISAQNFISLAGDASGDDHKMDAKEITYSTNSSNDSLFIRIHTYNPRGADFGFALAIDTNLNTLDGSLMSQNNLKNQIPNNSMRYDVALFAYQNSFFPTVYTETYDGNGNASTLSFAFDTTDAYYSTFGLPLSQFGGNYDMNIIGFTGSFDISPAGAGPGDAIPDFTFSALRTSELNVNEGLLASFSAYPNPVNDILHLESTSGESHLEILDLSGKKIMDIHLIAGTTVSLSHLDDGIYLLRNTENPEQMVKLLVEN